MTPFALLIAYICLLHLGPLLNLLGLLPGGRVFPITTMGHALALFLALRHFAEHGKSNLSKLDLAVVAYLIWSLASVVLFFQEGNPSEVESYWYGIHISVLPMFGYFAVKTIGPEKQTSLLRFILGSTVFALAFGIYLWWARPAFYTNYLQEIIFNGNDDRAVWQIYARLQSYLGSTAVGVLCAVTVALTGALSLPGWKTLILLGVALPGAMLTNQRGGMAATAIALLYLIFMPRKNRGFHMLISAGGTVVAAGLLVFLTAQTEGGLDYYVNRTEEFGSAFEDRSGYAQAAQYLTEFPLGVGLGGTLNASAAAGLSGWGKVVDANYMRISADLGIEGLLLFLIVMGLAMEAALRRRRNLGLATLVAIYALVAAGTNLFDGHIVPHIFWLFLGVADTPEEAPVSEVAKESALVEVADAPGLEPIGAHQRLG